MIFVHVLIGVILGKVYGGMFFFVLGSVVPDFDHVYVIVKNKFFSVRQIKDSIRFEEKFGVKYKTPLFHSVLGLVLFSVVVYFFSDVGVLYFALAYFLHLMVDWVDVDEKYYFYPLRVKFKGSLPIWSRAEQVLTVVLVVVVLLLYFG